MKKILSNLINRREPTTLTITAIRASDSELPVIIRNVEKLYGADSAQVRYLRGIEANRKRHFSPAKF